MRSSIRYKCSCCGKEHQGLPDVGFKSPAYFDSATQEARERNFKLTADTCVMDEGEQRHYFVRGVILVPILDVGENFGWGVWVSLSEKNFERYMALKDPSDIASEPPYYGWLSNEIKGYPTTLNLKCRVELQPGNKRPHITLEPTDHPLAVEQHRGMSLARAIEIVTGMEHPEMLKD